MSAGTRAFVAVVSTLSASLMIGSIYWVSQIPKMGTPECAAATGRGLDVPYNPVKAHPKAICRP